MLAALLFDFDGTIAETERFGHRVAYNAAFEELGLNWNWNDALYAELLAIGGGKERIAAYLARYRPNEIAAAELPRLIAALHERKQKIFATLVGTLRIRPGVRRLIRAARAEGVRIAIATTAARSGVDAIVGNDPDLSAAFDFIAAGDVVERKKPAPDIYAYALDGLQTPAHACIAIEDSAIGTRAARAAGIQTLVTLSEYTGAEDFSGAAAVLSDLGEPDAPARTLAGPQPPGGVVDLAYLRELLASAASGKV